MLRCSPATPNATSVVILVDECGKLSKGASRETEATINRLVEHCTTPISQPVDFRVVLHPDKTIEFASARDGGTDEVPICIVAQKLQHRIRLAAACTLHVRLTPTSIVAR